MSPRRNRIEKVVQHRNKELDRRIAEHTEHKNREEAARLAAERERQELLKASASRLKLAEAPLSANEWIEANEWLRTRSAQAELADTQAAKARVGTQRARAHVLHARTDLKKVEVLSARIGAEESAEQERADRRLEDELSALRFAAEHKREGK
jgi:flagellar biosynthesis chaperone FliJ